MTTKTVEKRTKDAKVVLSETQDEALAALVKAYDDDKIAADVAPTNLLRQEPGETHLQWVERINANKVRAVWQFRIKVSARSRWGSASNPTDITMKALTKKGVVEDVSHREFRPTETGRAYLAGEKVFVKVPAQPTRVEYTVTPAQAVEERRAARGERIETRLHSIEEGIARYIERLRDAADEIERHHAQFAADPRYRLGRTGYGSLTGNIYSRLTSALNNTRLDIISRDEVELAKLFAEEDAEKDDSGLNLSRVRWEYPQVEVVDED